MGVALGRPRSADFGPSRTAAGAQADRMEERRQYLGGRGAWRPARHWLHHAAIATGLLEGSQRQDARERAGWKNWRACRGAEVEHIAAGRPAACKAHDPCASHRSNALRQHKIMCSRKTRFLK